ncbi:hypothetical protein LTS18_005210, partial [Coniosporium uncinatum]
MSRGRQYPSACSKEVAKSLGKKATKKAIGHAQQALDTYKDLAASNPKKKDVLTATEPAATREVPPDIAELAPREVTLTSHTIYLQPAGDAGHNCDSLDESDEVGHMSQWPSTNTSLLLRCVSDKLNSAMGDGGFADESLDELVGQLNRQRLHDEAAEAIFSQKSSIATSPQESTSTLATSDSMSSPEEQDMPRTPPVCLGNAGSLLDTKEKAPEVFVSKDYENQEHNALDQQAEFVHVEHARSPSATSTIDAGLGISFLNEDKNNSETAIWLDAQQGAPAASSSTSSAEKSSSFRASIEELNKKHGLVFPDEEDELEQLIAEDNERKARDLIVATPEALDNLTEETEEEWAGGQPEDEEDKEEWYEEEPACDEKKMSDGLDDNGTDDCPSMPGDYAGKDNLPDTAGGSAKVLDMSFEDTVAQRQGFSSSAEWLASLTADEADRVHYVGNVSSPEGIAACVQGLIFQGWHPPSYAVFAKYVCYDDCGYLCVFLNGYWTRTYVQPLYNDNVDARFASERYAYDMAVQSSEGGDLLQCLSIKDGFIEKYLSQDAQIGLPTEMLFKQPVIRDAYSPNESGIGMKWSYPRQPHYQRQCAHRDGTVAKSRRSTEVKPEDIKSEDHSSEGDDWVVSYDGEDKLTRHNNMLTPFKPNDWIDRENEEAAADQVLHEDGSYAFHAADLAGMEVASRQKYWDLPLESPTVQDNPAEFYSQQNKDEDFGGANEDVDDNILDTEGGDDESTHKGVVFRTRSSQEIDGRAFDCLATDLEDGPECHLADRTASDARDELLVIKPEGLLTIDPFNSELDELAVEDKQDSEDEKDGDKKEVDPTTAILQIICTVAETSSYTQELSGVPDLLEGGDQVKEINISGIVAATPRSPPGLINCVPALQHEDIVAVLARVYTFVDTDAVGRTHQPQVPSEDTPWVNNEADDDDLYDDLDAAPSPPYNDSPESGSYEDYDSSTNSDESYF